MAYREKILYFSTRLTPHSLCLTPTPTFQTKTHLAEIALERKTRKFSTLSHPIHPIFLKQFIIARWLVGTLHEHNQATREFIVICVVSPCIFLPFPPRCYVQAQASTGRRRKVWRKIFCLIPQATFLRLISSLVCSRTEARTSGLTQIQRNGNTKWIWKHFRVDFLLSDCLKRREN
jgi:hypothetical protein